MNHATRLLSAAVTAVALASTFGCSPAHRAGRADRPAPAAGARTTAAPTAAPRSGAFCSVAPPASWTRAENAGTLTARPGETLGVLAVSPDGSEEYAASSNSTSDRLVRIRDHGARRDVVFSGSPATGHVVSADFDGRWLLFEVAPNTSGQDTDPGRWDLYAWDSQDTAAPKIIDSSNGKAPDSPWLLFEVRHGMATWLHPRTNGTRDIHLYDLAANRDSVVHNGHVDTPHLAGGLLVWPETFAANTPTRLIAISVTTHAPAPLPDPLATVRGPEELATDGTTWVWNSPDIQGVYAWRTGWPQPLTIEPAGGHEEWFHIAGDLITWTDDQTTHAADLRSHSATTIAPWYGGSVGQGKALSVGYPADRDGKSGTQVNYVVSTSALPALPACPAWHAVPAPKVTALPKAPKS